MAGKVYLDYASAAPVDKRVLKEMLPFMKGKIGNPSSQHSLGQNAKDELEKAREKVAKLVNAEAKEIVFTSGATEANNLAIIGSALRNKAKGNHVVTTKIEHMSVLNPVKALAKQGFETTLVGVDKQGLVDSAEIGKAITEKTVLVSVMYANGEIGTIQQIKEIGEICRKKGVVFHVDGTAACGKVPVDVVNDNIDLLTISSNNLYGPQGAGALFIRTGVILQPIAFGGGQERGLRSGTENISAIIGFGKACELAKNELAAEAERLIPLRDKLIKELTEKIPESYLNGHPAKRLPNNAHIRFSYIEGEAMVLLLNEKGVCASSGSACGPRGPAWNCKMAP